MIPHRTLQCTCVLETAQEERGVRIVGRAYRPQRIREEGADTREVCLQPMLMAPGRRWFLFFILMISLALELISFGYQKKPGF